MKVANASKIDTDCALQWTYYLHLSHFNFKQKPGSKKLGFELIDTPHQHNVPRPFFLALPSLFALKRFRNHHLLLLFQYVPLMQQKPLVLGLIYCDCLSNCWGLLSSLLLRQSHLQLRNRSLVQINYVPLNYIFHDYSFLCFRCKWIFLTYGIF